MDPADTTQQKLDALERLVTERRAADHLDEPDTIHISPALAKVLAGAILSSLLGIAGYMTLWAFNDAAFKQRVISHLDFLEKGMAEVRQTVAVVPANTQKIADLKERVLRLEDSKQDKRK